MKWNRNRGILASLILAGALCKDPEDKGTDEPAGGDKSPAGGGGAAADKKPKEGGEQRARGGESEEKPKPPPTARLLTGDEDDDELEAKTKYEVTGSAFKRRIDRASKTQLREMFGTDDAEKVKEDWKRYQQLEKKADDDRRAKMDENAKLKEDNDKLQKQLSDVTAQAQSLEEDRIVDGFVSKVARIAQKYIDSEYVDDIVWGAFKRYAASLDEDEQNAMKEKHIEAWFKEYAEQKPKFAREGAGQPEKDKNGGDKSQRPGQQQQRVGGTNGISDRTRPNQQQGNAATGEKTARPGQPNSMNPAEYQAFRRQVVSGAR